MSVEEIVEKIEQELSDNTNLYFEIRKSTSEHCSGLEYKWFNYVRFRDFIHELLNNDSVLKFKVGQKEIIGGAKNDNI